MSNSSSVKNANEAAFEEVCDLLQLNHRKRPQHTPRYTLNRLFRKDLGDEQFTRSDLPMLTPENVSVRLERRSKVDLCKLDQSVSERKPKRTDVPVVIISFAGKDRLIDGHSRYRLWRANNETNDHDAWVLTVGEA